MFYEDLRVIDLWVIELNGAGVAGKVSPKRQNLS